MEHIDKMIQEIEVDLDAVKTFIEKEEFARYLLENTQDFTVAAYILQALIDRVNADAQTLDNK